MTQAQGMNLKKTYDQGLTYLFTDVSFTIDQGKHIALVGANGSGKTTLLRIIAGLEDADGSLHVSKKLKIGYHTQEPIYPPGKSVRAVLEENYTDLNRIATRMHELEELLHTAGSDLEGCLAEYGSLQEIFQAQGGYETEQEMLKVSAGLGFTPKDLDKPAASLSGGEKSKLTLACQLLQKPDLMLLDEPTNHLDLASIEWLEHFLTRYGGTLLIVSHDRYFLDQVAEEIWELEHGSLTMYSGNYSRYIDEKKKRLKNQWLEYSKQQKAMQSLAKQVRDQRNYAEQAERSAHGPVEADKSFLRRKAKKTMHKAKVAEAKLERLETRDRVEKPQEEREIKLHFPIQNEVRGGILHVKNLEMAYQPDAVLFKDLSFSLFAGGKTGIIGPNGAGKTTLFKLILGALEPVAGEIVKAGGLRIGYYSQEQETLKGEQSALQNILNSTPVDETLARTILGCLHIEKEQVHVLVNQMSGGEKSKIQLAKILLSGANLLLLDEPTNHLDISAREGIEDALLQYPGAVLFISHDRYFIQKMAQELIYLNGAETKIFPGNYQAFKAAAENPPVSAEEMIRNTRLAALLGRLSILKETEVEEKERLKQQIDELASGKGVAFSVEG